jgi:hypothetical protein
MGSDELMLVFIFDNRTVGIIEDDEQKDEKGDDR